MVLDPGVDGGDGLGDLAGHEVLAAARRLVVEQDPGDREQPVGLAVVHRHPVRLQLGGAVRRARVELGVLVLRGRRRTEHLRGRGLVEAAVELGRPDRLQQPERADRVGRGGVVGHLEGHLHVAHRAQVVDLVGLDGAHQVDQADPVGQVAVVQVQPVVVVQVVDPGPVQHRGAADQAVHLVALAEEELGQVGTVLAGDPGDEGCLHPRSLTCPHRGLDARMMRQRLRGTPERRLLLPP